MLELRLRLPDLPGLLRGKQVGHEQRPHLDLPGLRTGAYDGVKLMGAEALPAMFNQGRLDCSLAPSERTATITPLED